MSSTVRTPKVLLVIECQGHLNWYEVFRDAQLSDGTPIVVEQAEWDDISIVSYPDSGVQVSLNRAKKPLPGTSQQSERTTNVHFVLLRSVTRSIKGQDSRNKLYALMHGNLPSVNSLYSAYACLERPVVFGALKGIENKLGHKNFPLISQTFYASPRNMLFTPDYPLIAKVAHVHAGYGKMKIDNSQQFADFRSVVAVHGDYATAEPFIKWDYDMRVQKIGPHYRGFKRRSPNWKGNVGNTSVIEDMEVTPRYKRMVDECAKLFGGLDILGLDLLHSEETGEEYILELNDTAIGLVHKYEREDMGHVADLVIARMNALFVKKDASSTEKAPPNPEVLLEEIDILRNHIERDKMRYEAIVTKTAVSKNKGEETEEEDSSSPTWFFFFGITVAVIVIALIILFFSMNFTTGWLFQGVADL